MDQFLHQLQRHLPQRHLPQRPRALRQARVDMCATTLVMDRCATTSLATVRWTRRRVKRRAPPERVSTCAGRASAIASLATAPWTRMLARRPAQSPSLTAWWYERSSVQCLEVRFGCKDPLDSMLFTPAS